MVGIYHLLSADWEMFNHYVDNATRAAIHAPDKTWSQSVPYQFGMGSIFCELSDRLTFPKQPDQMAETLVSTVQGHDETLFLIMKANQPRS